MVILRQKKLLAIVLTIAFSQALIGQQLHENSIVVTGTGEVEILADKATFHLSLSGVGPNMEKALASAQRKVDKTVKTLRSANIAENDISVSRFRSGTNQGSQSLLTKKDNFRASFSIGVSITDLSNLENAIVSLSQNDIDALSEISFSLADPDLTREESRRLAMEDARKSAQQLATHANVSLGAVTSITETKIGDMRPLRYQPRQMNANFETTSVESMSNTGGFLPQTIIVKARVTVAYAIK